MKLGFQTASQIANYRIVIMNRAEKLSFRLIGKPLMGKTHAIRYEGTEKAPV